MFVQMSCKVELKVTRMRHRQFDANASMHKSGKSTTFMRDALNRVGVRFRGGYPWPGARGVSPLPLHPYYANKHKCNIVYHKYSLFFYYIGVFIGVFIGVKC